MNISELFQSPIMTLPRERADENFEQYLKECFQAYLDAVRALVSSCHLCSRIQSQANDIERLMGWITDSVRNYLEGKPAAAYQELVKGIDFVYPRLQTLLSRDINSAETGRLYRLADTKGTKPPKERLFHTPLHLRHKVRQHRYGIPGFPCLYLGGSLELCVEECRVQPADLPGVAIAEFALRDKVRVLDFGYRPSALAKVAAGSAMRKPGENPELENFIINYAMCWPLVAAASIKVLHEGEPFMCEYIVPQMILQWVMTTEECDGLRYFSSRFTPDPEAIRGTANYVFPAIHGITPLDGYSERLKNLFEFTEPRLWGALQHPDLRQDARLRERQLEALTKAPLKPCC